MKINGDAVVRYRQLKGLTQSELAEQLGIALRTIQNYEAGSPIPQSKIKMFEALLRATEMDEKFIQGLEHSYREGKFQDLTTHEITAYIINNLEYFQADPTFKLFMDKLATDRALKILKDL